MWVWGRGGRSYSLFSILETGKKSRNTYISYTHTHTHTHTHTLSSDAEENKHHEKINSYMRYFQQVFTEHPPYVRHCSRSEFSSFFF